MTLDQMLQGTQLAVTILALAGIAFSLGRVFGRIERLESALTEIKNMLTGGEDGGGIFLRRTEAELMLTSANQARDAFDKRLDEFATRMGALERDRDRKN